MRAAGEGAPEGSVFLAEEQLAGRGRGAHKWHSARSAGIYCSAVFRPAMPPSEATLFEMHLNFCDGCFTFIDQIRATSSIAGRVAEEQVPEETKVKLLEAFRDWKRG